MKDIKMLFKNIELYETNTIWIHGTEPVTKGIRYSINCFLAS